MTVEEVQAQFEKEKAEWVKNQEAVRKEWEAKISEISAGKQELAETLEKLKREQEENALSEQEKAQKLQKELEKNYTLAQKEAEQYRKEATRTRKIAELVAFHGLLNPDFGDVVLKGWDGESDFDKHVESVKESDKYKVLFGSGQDVVVQAPGSPGDTGRSQHAPAKDINDEDKLKARELFPKSEQKQKAYLENLKRVRSE